MAKEYKCLSAMERDIEEKFRVAYDKGYKQGYKDAEDDVKDMIGRAKLEGYLEAKSELTEKENEKISCKNCHFKNKFPDKEPCCACDNYNLWHPEEEGEESTETQEYDYEKDYEGCDKCIFESFDLDDKCCRCKHNEPYFNESHFIPKPCQHEWEEFKAYDSNNFIIKYTGNGTLYRCKKCGLLRIEV